MSKGKSVSVGLLLTGFLLLANGCANDSGETSDSSLRSDINSALDPALGGETTRTAQASAGFGLPAPNLDREGRRRFEVGDSFFTLKWVTAPATTTARDGLGPTFNATACGACHVKDGRAAPPTEDSDFPGLLLRLSVPGESGPNGAPVGVEGYSDQLQDNAVLEVPAEGLIKITRTEVPGSFADGTPWSLEKPTYEIASAAFGSIPAGTLISPRLAPPVFGVGLLEAIPAEDIEERADPNDNDGDGISGRTNQVWNQRAEKLTLGRFGWKANQPTVEQQVAGAFLGDIGITSSLNPNENCPAIQFGCSGAVGGGSPEISDDLLSDVVFYNKTLSVPFMRDSDDSEVISGFETFESIGCASCHVPKQRTTTSDIAALENQTIYPYTDLLLHDMGEGLADDRPDFDASGTEWRTPPLWGIGLTEAINGHTRFLHDGRARSIEEAILWHGGEAQSAQSNYISLDTDDRSALLRFLNAL